MNLLCPHCQQMLSVPEESAGQVMKCPLCNNTFPVPALPAGRPEPGTIPSEIPLAPLPPAPDPAPAGTSTPPEHEEPVYKIATEPQQPAPPLFPSRPRGEPKAEGPPRRDERITATASRSPTPPPPTAQPPPPPPPPTGYVHTARMSLSPHVVAWIAPLALVPLLLLLFFPWVGVYPGGYGVYTQNAFQAMVGACSRDEVGKKVLKNDEETRKLVQTAIDRNKELGEEELTLDRPIQYEHGNYLLVLYLLFLLLALVLAAAPLVLAQTQMPIPAVLQAIWPWRSALLIGAVSLAFLILLLELSTNFHLESAVKSVVDRNFETASEKATTPEEKESVSIQKSLQLGRFQLQRTGWLRWAVFFHLLAIAGAGLELWLEKRGKRPAPRLDVLW